MKRSEFFYDLPEELIAQTPLEDRCASRLMVFDKKTGALEHRTFKDITDYLKPGDCLVLNNTRVLPARLYGEKKDNGSAIEFLLLTKKALDTWEILCKPGKKAKVGTRFVFGGGKLEAEVVEVMDNGNRVVKFYYDGVFESVLDELGEMPLPHYIKEKLEDGERYQTVYSKHTGSAAAPTAGLHFTNELLDKIRDMGVNIAFVTLHVGLGTFRPVKADIVEEHTMHSEFYTIDEQTADIINKTKQGGGRVISVGTTSNRVLETVADENGMVREQSGWTDIFIYPGYRFKCSDCLITNFHLPESTLIMLVCAFAGYDNTLNAYNTAVAEKYRFFSFGDAMFIC